MYAFNKRLQKLIFFLFLLTVFSCKNKIIPEIECIGLNYTLFVEKMEVEVLLQNNSNIEIGIPYRFFEQYEESDNKTLVIKTFTEKERKGDFSLCTPDDAILCDDLEAVNSYTLLTEVKPGDCVVLFFDFDTFEHIHKTSIKEISEYNQIFIEFLYVDFTSTFDINKTYVSRIPVKYTPDLIIPTFDTFSYIDSWEKSVIFIDSSGNVKFVSPP